MNYDVLSVILGGGKGTRLHPLTQARSKPSVPIAGKYRLVDIPISNCINSRINKIFVLTQFNSASLNSHVKNTYVFDNFTKGFTDILAAEQTPESGQWYQGTADAIRQSMHHLLNVDFEYMLILSGDQLYQMDYSLMLDFHKKTQADVTLATLPVHANDATGFGIMKTENSEITTFTEKPSLEELAGWESAVSPEMEKQERRYLASMGIYMFNRQVLIDALQRDPNETDFGKDIIPALVNDDKKVMAYQFEGYWTDIGTIKSFFEANIELTKNLPQFNLYDEKASVFTRARMLPPSKIYGTQMESTIVSEGCIIRAESLEKSVIGIRTRIGTGTKVMSSYVMGSDYFEDLRMIEDNKSQNLPDLGIGENCSISHAIIDKNVRIGHNVVLHGGPHLEDAEDDFMVIRDGIIVVKKNAVIPSGSVVGLK